MYLSYQKHFCLEALSQFLSPIIPHDLWKKREKTLTYIYLSLTVSVNHAPLPLKSNILSSARGEPCRNQGDVHKTRLPERSFHVQGTRERVFMLSK